MTEEFDSNTNNNLSDGKKQPEHDAATDKPDAKNSSESASLDTETTKKIIYSLCYLWGILFFLPLILYKGDRAATRHANEGLLLLLLSVIGNIVFGVLSIFGWFFGLIAGLYSLVLLIFGIIGIVYVVTDKNEPLPIIGSIRLIK